MKSAQNPRRHSQVGLLATASVAAMLACGVAHAQTAPPSEAVEEVVVTGIRQSLQSAVSMKKNTMEVVDSIRAEDIGKLPDPNVAETLTRIPGVQGYRYGGEGASPVGAGSGLTIRGLSGQTASQVDGRAYFTAGGREFNIEGAIPGMIAGLDVYKNPSAEHIEGGIGGLINVLTRRPLDLKGFTASAAISGRYNELTKSVQPEYFGLIANRWAVGDGEMGLLLGANYQKSFNRSDNAPGPGGTQLRRAAAANSADCSAANLGGSYNATYASRSDLNCLINVSDSQALAMTAAERQNLISMSGVQTNVFQEDIRRTRKGLNGAFQWKPKPNLEFYVDGNYNYYLYHQSYRFLIPSDSRYVQNLKTTPFTITEGLANRNINGGENAVLSGQKFASGTFVGSNLSTTGGDEHRPYTTYVLASGVKWSPSENLDLHLDVAYVKADQTQDNRSVTLIPRTGLTWDITRSMGLPQTIAYSGPDLASAATWAFGQYGNGTNQTWDDTGLAVAFDGKYHLDRGFLKTLKFGTRYATQKSKYFSYGYGGKWLTTDGAGLTANQSNAIFATSMPDLVTGSPTNWFGGDAGYGGGYMVFNPDALLGDNVRNRFPLAGIPADASLPEVLLARRTAEEKTLAVYGVADFAFLNDRIRGNAGVRVVKTDLSAEARVNNTTTTPTTIVPRTAGTEYTDVLPSLNVTGYITPDTLLRFGYGKGLTRAGVADLNPSISVSAPAAGVGSQGNPNLKPLRADSYDLSLEQYFSSTNYVSAALFYKSIDGFFLGVDSCQTVSTAPPATSALCQNGQYLVTQTVNAQSGTAKGVEVAFQTFFDYDFVPDALKKFGVQGSYTYVKTELPVKLTGTTGPTTVVRQPFQSDNNYSLAGLYENDFVSARIVYTYRSDYVLFGVSANPIDGRYLKGYGLLDASVNFNLRKELTLSLTASNLTNKAPQRYVGEPDNGYDTDILRQSFMNGRIYGVSLRYKFGG